MASSRLVLPAPVGPWTRKSPSAESASTSTTTGSANGPKAVDLEPVQPHAAPARAGCAVGARGHALVVADLSGQPAGLDGLGEQRRARRRSAPRPPRTWPRKSQQTSTSVAVRDPCGVGAQRRRRRPAGRNRSSRVCGNRRRSLLHRPQRAACASVSVTWHQARLGGGVRRVGEQLLEGAAQDGERALDRAVDVLDAPPVSPARSTSRRALGVAHSENDIAHRGPAVADPGRRPAAGRAGDRGRRSRRRRRPSGWTAETPPTEMSRSESLVTPAGDEGVGHDDRAPAALLGGRRRPGPSRRAAPRRGCARRLPRRVGGQGGLEVGEGVDGHVADQHRPADVGHARSGCAARPARAARRRTRAGSRESWLPLRQHDLGTGVDQPGHGLGEQLDGVGGRASPGRRRRRDTSTASTRSAAHRARRGGRGRPPGRRAAPPGGTRVPGASRRCGQPHGSAGYESGRDTPLAGAPGTVRSSRRTRLRRPVHR